MPIPGLSLVGFMERKPALNYFRSACYLPGESEAELVNRWHTAHGQRGAVSGTPGQPEMLDVPASAATHNAAVQAHPRFSETCSGMPYAFQLVEISPLLAFQFHVIDNAATLCDPSAGTPPLSTALDLCLPLTETIPTISGVTLLADGFAIRSPDMNARPLEYVPGMDSAGRPVAGISIAQRSSFVHAVRFGGRVYLKNGYHRARALAVAGATHMPAIVLDATSFDQVGAVDKGMTFDQPTLARRNAPTCGHLIDGRAYDVPIRRHGQVIEARLFGRPEALE